MTSLRSAIRSDEMHNLALGRIVKFHDSFVGSGAKPETHIYSTGGHGFGMKKQGTSSDHWIEEFYWWLEAQGLTKPAEK